MPDVSYLITYRNSDPARQRSLHCILASLASLPDIEIILVEQDDKADCNEADLPAQCRYLFGYNPGLFNKSWGLNLAAGLATTQNMIFADADMLLSEESFKLIKMQFESGADAINPYSELIDLTADETEAIITGQRHISIERSETQKNRKGIQQHLPFCGGVFALKQALYQQTGGFDERFSGWGAEDNAMSLRVAHFAKQAINLDGQYAYHLWHPSSSTDPAHQAPYLANLARLSRYYEFDKQFYADIAFMDTKYKANIDKFKTPGSTDHQSSLSPLISCLCVTRARITELKQAIKCYRQQSYPNKELLIVYEDDDQATIEFLMSLDDADIRGHILPATPKLTLGELRNAAIQAAKGDYICQWDDDDWYHPRRLELQLKSARKHNKAASILPRWLIYAREDDKAYCSNIRLWEGSLLCQKAILHSGPGYPAIAKGEDTSVIAWLYIQDQLAVEDQPDLYVYIHSGKNTWGDSHFKKILDSSSELKPQDTAHLRSLLKIT